MELEIEFRSGRVYRYQGVPPGLMVWLLRSKNKGAFVTRMIAGRYHERAVATRAAPAGARLPGSPQNEELSLEQALRASLAQLPDPKQG